MTEALAEVMAPALGGLRDHYGTPPSRDHIASVCCDILQALSEAGYVVVKREAFDADAVFTAKSPTESTMTDDHETVMAKFAAGGAMYFDQSYDRLEWFRLRDGRWLCKIRRQMFMDVGDTLSIKWDDWVMRWTWNKPETLWEGEVAWLPGAPEIIHETSRDRLRASVWAGIGSGLFRRDAIPSLLERFDLPLTA